MSNCHYPFQLEPLPYAENALASVIDAETLRLHHGAHLKTYVDNLNAALAPLTDFHQMSLEDLILNHGQLPPTAQMPVWNNAGGVYNHNLYFSLLAEKPGTPSKTFSDALNAAFGSMEGFKTAMKTAAMAQFGSGYSWLVLDAGKLTVIKTANQDTPLPSKLKPLLLIDVWEHAYYLKYRNLRASYLDAFWQIVNWDKISQLYDQACKG